MRLKTKFQDEDFKLGEVVDAYVMYGYDDKIEVSCTEKMKHRNYNSIKDFTDHWEDAPEEPKEYWGIDYTSCRKGGIEEFTYDNDNIDEFNKSIGNYFETKEEAEKAVEKLKAWKRLKDIGCRFVLDDNFAVKFVGPEVKKIVSAEEGRMLCDDYRLLFGGEDESEN